MELVYECRLPFPVSVNGMLGGGGGQQRFKSKSYKAWLAKCPALSPINIDYPVHVSYEFSWPCKRARDGQNYMKCVLDYLVNQGVMVDDNWKIVQSETWRHVGVNSKNSYVIVKIHKL